MIVWMTLCVALVFIMQTGFLCLEAGSVRTKNSTNVAVKNILDLLISSAVFWTLGFGLAFGPSLGGWLGTPGWLFESQEPEQIIYFLVQMMFCGAAVTIVSGAVAERMNLKAYILLSVIVAAAIYPFAAHWVWGGDATTPGLLSGWGMIDLAGCSVVHVVGGAAGLAGVLLIGPRLGRFGKDAVAFRPHSLPLATLGATLLWFGWIGFNCVSGGEIELIPRILVNTFAGGIAGGVIVPIFLSILGRPLKPMLIIGGILSGLIAVTAGAHLFVVPSAAAAGAVGGLLFLGGSALLVRLRIDDAVDAIPAHLFVGIWGVVSVAIFADDGAIPAELSRLQWIAVQTGGVLMIAVFAFAVSYGLMRLVGVYTPLRVSAENERIGLNIAEHGESNELDQLLQVMESHRTGEDISERVVIEPGTETEPIAAQYNRVVDKLASSLETQATIADELRDRIDEAERLRVLAEEASIAKSDFLANMSHEIRTPMTAILGYTDLLNEELASESEQTAEAMQTIQSNASHLLTVINDVLDVSKIEAGQMTVECIDTNPAQITEEVASLTRPRAVGKGVKLCVRYESPVPERIQSDPTRLRQILLNLAGNAIKFTETGSITISASYDEEVSLMHFRVIDSGIGMTPDQVRKISQFEAFAQADTSMARQYGGSGLGLRISNSLAQMLGGGIKVESTYGQGSTFTLTVQAGALEGVPLIEPNHIAMQNQPRAKEAERDKADAPNANKLAGCQVLLAEDGPDNQRLIQFHLKKAGAQVMLCDNGRIAAETIENAGTSDLPHVVLMDMQMPELDGYGATRRLRKAGFSLPIVALTAHAMMGDRKKCLDAGCDDYLTKPIDKEKLIEACAKWASVGASER